MTKNNTNKVELGPIGGEYSVLLVDDDANRLQTLADILRPAGLKLLFATDGSMALETARLAGPDLVLLNAGAAALEDGTDLDGHATMHRLREQSEGANFVVMVICPAAALEARATAFAMGAVDVIASPFPGDELLARIENQRRIQALQLPPRRTVAEGTDPSIPESSPGSATDGKDWLALVSELDGLLRSGNTRALGTLRVLMGRIGEPAPSAWLVLAEQVEAYDFKRALATLDTLSLT